MEGRVVFRELEKGGECLKQGWGEQESGCVGDRGDGNEHLCITRLTLDDLNILIHLLL